MCCNCEFKYILLRVLTSKESYFDLIDYDSFRIRVYAHRYESLITCELELNLDMNYISILYFMLFIFYVFKAQKLCLSQLYMYIFLNLLFVCLVLFCRAYF